MTDLLHMLYPFQPPERYLFYDLLGLLFIVAFFDFKHLRRLRNLDVVMLCAWVPLGDYELGNLKWTMVLGYLPLLYFLPRLLYQVWRTNADPCTINFSTRTLKGLAALFFVAGCALALVYPIPFRDEGLSDTAESGMSSARMLLQGQIPYGNLKHGWDSYPPAYYYTYVPFEWLVSDGKTITNNPRPWNTHGWSARVLTCTLNGTCMLALLALGTRLYNRHFGWALAFGWAVLPYTLMSTAYSQTGHILPAAFSVFALLIYSQSVTFGAVSLGVLAAAAFYPVLFAPVWAARLDRRRAMTFLLIVGVVGLALWLPMLAQHDGVSKFFNAIKHQETQRHPFSPWDQHPWTKPLRTVFAALYLPFVAWAAWAAHRRRGFVPLIALTGAVVVWGQLFYRSAPGRYHLWMMPFLMTALLLGQPRAAFEGGENPKPARVRRR